MSAESQYETLRRHVEGRMSGLITERYSWWTHWRDLADFYLPRRYKFLITPNQANRGSPINQHIIDSTGTIAARNLASGMMSGITSPTRPWFKLRIGRADSTQTSPASLWLAEVERLMMLIFQESNFYNSIATVYFDLVIFGTSSMLIYEDFDNVINCYNPCLGEFYLANNARLQVGAFYRQFVMTGLQIQKEFGEDNIPDVIKTEVNRTQGAAWTHEWVVAHAIEENSDPGDWGLPAHFKWREVYWLYGTGQDKTTQWLRKRGFFEQPFIAPRWDLVSNDPYGRSPAMDGLGDVKQLQQETRRKAQAIDKMVNPPMVADIQLKNQPASLLPGGVTYVAGLGRGEAVGFRPAYTVAPPVKEIMEDLNEVRDRIKSILFNDLFQMISQYEPKSGVTATEMDARREEKMILLGPVLERFQSEGLKVIIERVYNIASRAGVFPPPPAEIAGQPIQVDYVSMLAETQKAARTSGVERVLGLAGNLVGVDPAVMDNIDIDYAIASVSHDLGNDPKLIRSPEALAQIRAQRQKQQQAQQQEQQLNNSVALAQGAKTLSETNVGGSRNALQAITGM